MKCSMDDCDKKVRTKNLCSKHYMQDYRAQVRAECSIDECVRAVYSRELCESHYKSLLRQENPDYDTAQILAGRNRDRGEGSKYQKRLEYNRELTKLRNPLGFRKEIVTYASAHRRVRQWRGSAKTYSCIDCGGTARDWSLRHDAPNVHKGPDKDSIMNYSLNIWGYEPRCAICHGAYDRKYPKSH